MDISIAALPACLALAGLAGYAYYLSRKSQAKLRQSFLEARERAAQRQESVPHPIRRY